MFDVSTSRLGRGIVKCCWDLTRKSVIVKVYGIQRFQKLCYTLSSCHNFKICEKKTKNGTETKKDERPQFFALMLQKLAINFYRTLLVDTRMSSDETVKAYRYYNEKQVLFWGGYLGESSSLMKN